jgi:uncharacterized membrane protein
VSDEPGPLPGPPAGPLAANDNEADDSIDGSPDRSSTDRLAFFSDAVFAIAITLLAIDIRIPADLPSNTDDALIDALRALAPAIFAYGLSFMAVAAFWTGHHRTFRVLQRIDNRLVLLNFVFLAFVALLPFPTSVVARHGDLVSAAVFYALFLALTAALSAALFVYPVRAGLMAAAVTSAMARHIEYRAAVVPLLFLASIPIARFIGPYAAEASWILGFPLQALLTRYFGLERAFAQ